MLSPLPAVAREGDLPALPIGTAIAGAGLVLALALAGLAWAISRSGERASQSVETAATGIRDGAARARDTQHDDLTALRAAAREGREALEHRLDLLTATVQGRSREDALILAESLAGELQAVQMSLETHLIRLDAHLSERAEAGYSKVSMRDLLPRVGAPVFSAQAGRIGLLGASLAGDLAWVHGSFHAWMNLESAASTRQGTMALDEAQDAMEAMEDVREGVLHLIRRLLGFIDGQTVSPSARDLINDRVAARAEALMAAEDDAEDSLEHTSAPEPLQDGSAREQATAAPSARAPIHDVRLHREP